MSNYFRLATNLYVPDANEAYQTVLRAKENSKHEYNWLLNDIVIAIDAQANTGSTYLYYEFQQWRSEAAYYSTCQTMSPCELMKRWKEIVDIFYNIIAVLKERNYQVFFRDNHPMWLVIAWDVNNRVGELLAARHPHHQPDDNALSDKYNPQYDVGKETEILPAKEEGIARRLLNMIDPDPRDDPLSDQYMT